MGRETRGHEVQAIMTQVQTYGRGTRTVTKFLDHNTQENINPQLPMHDGFTAEMRPMRDYNYNGVKVDRANERAKLQQPSSET